MPLLDSAPVAPSPAPRLGAAPVEEPPTYLYVQPQLPDFDEPFSPDGNVSSAHEELAAHEQAAMMRAQAEEARLAAQASVLPPAPSSELVGQMREQERKAEHEQASVRRVSKTAASESKDGLDSVGALSVGPEQANAQGIQDLDAFSSTGLESTAGRVGALFDASAFAMPEEAALNEISGPIAGLEEFTGPMASRLKAQAARLGGEACDREAGRERQEKHAAPPTEIEEIQLCEPPQAMPDQRAAEDRIDAGNAEAANVLPDTGASAFDAKTQQASTAVGQSPMAAGTPKRSWFSRMFGSQNTPSAEAAPQASAAVVSSTQDQTFTRISPKLDSMGANVAEVGEGISAFATADNALVDLEQSLFFETALVQAAKAKTENVEEKHMQRDRRQVTYARDSNASHAHATQPQTTPRSRLLPCSG